MEAKKNPDKDVNRKSGQFFLIGLSISISIMITAFEWRTEIIPITYKPTEFEEPVILADINVPQIKTPKLSEETPVKSKSTTPSFTPIEIAHLPLDKDIETTELPDLDLLASSTSVVSITDAPETDTTFFIFVQEQPEPVNGYKNFYQNISRTIKYPAQARRMNIEGKVFVEFIVNRKGDATEVNVMKGIGAGCDEEAMRVIALSKWQPGKQRGQPVRVKMVMPVTFKLN
jgi:protein TonB